MSRPAPINTSRPRASGLALAAGLCAASAGLLPEQALGGVATLITHGLYQTADDWVTQMGKAMARHPRRQFEFGTSSPTIYRLSFDKKRNLQAKLVDGTQPSQEPSGDVILLLDWNPFSGALIPTDGLPESTTVVGPLVADALLSSELVPELHGPVARLPLHLVGFSRGGSLVAEISKRLGQRGLVVDHLTLLDAHPLNNDGSMDGLLPPAGWFIKDGTAENGVYENVLFADAYFQTLFMPVGAIPKGAFIRSLNNWELNSGGYRLPHEDVHLWYHGTVEVILPITSDGEQTLTESLRQRWYAPHEQSGRNAGYQYSLRAGGDRREVFQTVDAASGFPQLGLNQSWGSALEIPSGSNRVPLMDRLPEIRPNILEFHLTGPTIQDMASSPLDFSLGAPLKEIVLSVGSEPLKARMVYLLEGTDTAVLTVHADLDGNTLNGTLKRIQFSIPPTGAQPRAIELDLIALQQGLDRGRYWIGASLETGSMTRESLAPEQLRVAEAQVPALKVFVVEPSGGAPNVELLIQELPQTHSRLEGSTDLRTWVPVLEMNPAPAGELPRILRHGVAPGESLRYFRLRTLD